MIFQLWKKKSFLKQGQLPEKIKSDNKATVSQFFLLFVFFVPVRFCVEHDAMIRWQLKTVTFQIWWKKNFVELPRRSNRSKRIWRIGDKKVLDILLSFQRKKSKSKHDATICGHLRVWQSEPMWVNYFWQHPKYCWLSTVTLKKKLLL